VTPGSLTVDSTGSRLFAVVRPLQDTCNSASDVNLEMAVFEMTTGQLSMLALGVNVTLR
jgi:hypothetical protein